MGLRYPYSVKHRASAVRPWYHSGQAGPFVSKRGTSKLTLSPQFISSLQRVVVYKCSNKHSAPELNKRGDKTKAPLQ